MDKRWVRTLAALLCLVMMLALVPGTSRADANSRGDDYPQKYKDPARDAVVDEWNFYNRECTSFVAWCLNSRNGVGFHNYYAGVHWGHAKNWGTAASNAGILVDNNPAVGSVAWSSAGTYGHVAWVSSVNGSNVVIEEYNYSVAGCFSSRTVSKGSFSGFIHINDIPPIVTYTVTYDANGGSGAPGQQTKTKGKALTLSSTKPSRASTNPAGYTVTLNPNGGKVDTTSLTATRTTSYTFKNWNTAKNGSGTAYNPGASYTADANVTLYAQWNSSTSTASVTLPTPWRYGYTFKGWAESSTAASGVTGSYKPSKSLTLYAAWAKEDLSGWSTTKPNNIYEDQIETATQYRYSDRTVSGGWTKTGSGTIDYVKSWPSGFDTSNSLYSQYNKTPKTVGVSGSKKVEASTAANGWIYWHWTYNNAYTSGGNFNVFISDTPYYSEGGRYYQYFDALWSSTDAGHVDPNGKNGGECFYLWRDVYADGSWWWWRIPVYRQTYTEYTGANSSETWSDWSVWTMVKYSATDNRKVDTRTVYRYKSSVKPLTATFNSNGGSCNTASKSVIRGETYGSLPKPTRTGCTFDGWYTAKEGGNKVTDTTRVTATGAHTLYAHWTVVHADGLALVDGVWKYYRNGVVDTAFEGLVYGENIGWFYVRNGGIDFTFTGIAYGESLGYWYVKDGALNPYFTGVARNRDMGLLYCENGYVSFAWNGTYKQDGLTYTVTNSRAAVAGSNPTGMLCLDGNVWRFYRNGVVDTAYEGLALGEGIGFFYVKNGTIDFTFTGIAFSPDIGYWYTKDGALNPYFTGVARNRDLGLLYCDNGYVNFVWNGTFTQNGVTYAITNSRATAVDPNRNGIYLDGSTWHYYRNGVINTTYEGYALGEGIGFFYVKNGQIDFSFTGIAYGEGIGYWYGKDGALNPYFTGVANSRDFGLLFCDQGYVNFVWNGTFTQDGVTYAIENSRARVIS